MPLHVSSTCAHHQEAKIVLYSLWYHHTCRWPSRAQSSLNLCTVPWWYQGCIIQFWPPDDEHMCSTHVEAWNKLIVKQILCISLVNYWDKWHSCVWLLTLSSFFVHLLFPFYNDPIGNFECLDDRWIMESGYDRIRLWSILWSYHGIYWKDWGKYQNASA